MERAPGQEEPQATLKDVAQLAGVSIRTVSNVVRGATPVREATRLRVQQAIDELGYQPNIAARHLRSGRVGAIGLVLPDVTVPYFREFADEVLLAARAHELTVIVEQTHGDSARERTVLSNPRLGHVDGIVLTAVALSASDLAAPPARPVVIAGAGSVVGEFDSAMPNEYRAGAEIGRLFGRLGRTHPVLVSASGPRFPVTETDRFRGFVAGLAEYNVAFDEAVALVNVPTVSLRVGHACVPEVLRRRRDVDALFANADALALGVLRGLHDAGVSVPKDIAVVGYGGVEYSAHSHPTLTTVDTLRGATARAAVQMILDRLEGTLPAQPRHVVVGFQLVERESTGAVA